MRAYYRAADGSLKVFSSTIDDHNILIKDIIEYEKIPSNTRVLVLVHSASK